MVNMFLKMFKLIFSLLKVPLLIIAGTLLLFILMVLIHMIILAIKGEKRKSGIRIRVKKHNIFVRILWDAPKQFVRDMYDMEPDYFRYQGMIIFCGRQGMGKTISMIENAMMMQKEYPLAKCITNLKYEYQDEKLEKWEQLVDYKNGHQGVIVCMDELQNWFSSNQSRNFPEEMLSVITQNRKNRRIILGTAQSFNLLAKPIRTQTTEVRDCITLAGCVTIVFRKEPFLNSEGDVEKWKHRGMYMYVHSPQLRNSYDTYEVIENLKKSGFKEKLRVTAE